MKKEILVTSVKQLAKKLKVSEAKAKELVKKENKRLYQRGTPKSVPNPSKMVHSGDRSKYTYRVSDFKKHM